MLAGNTPRGAWAPASSGHPLRLPGRIDEEHDVAAFVTALHVAVGAEDEEGPSVSPERFRNQGERWGGFWADPPEATAVTSALEAGWDPAEVPEAVAASDSFVDGVEWFMADREFDGRAGELVRFALVWMAGGGFISGAPDRISLAGAAAYAEGGGGNLVPSGGYRALVDRLASGHRRHRPVTPPPRSTPRTARSVGATCSRCAT